MSSIRVLFKSFLALKTCKIGVLGTFKLVDAPANFKEGVDGQVMLSIGHKWFFYAEGQ